jgi:hypothetical protein
VRLAAPFCSHGLGLMVVSVRGLAGLVVFAGMILMRLGWKGV